MADENPKDIEKGLKRKRGAQPGNKNALRHGFYSECFTSEENNLLDEDFNPEEVLKVLRVKALRLAKLTPLESLAAKELMALDRLFKALQEMNTIERTRILAHGHGGEVGKAILEALDEMDPYDLDI